MSVKTLSRHGTMLLAIFMLGIVTSAQDVGELRREVERQKAVIEAQKKALEEQNKKLDEIAKRLSDIEGQAGSVPPADAKKPDAVATAVAKPTATPPIPQEEVRDPVGDLNSEAVARGEFPGSFRVGRDDKISLGFGGFIKAAAFYDNNFEQGLINPLPQILGLLGPDTRGGFNLDASLSRFNVDGRAKVPGGSVRGYIEFDFASSTNFKLRHAYLNYTTKHGKLTAGQTWSNFMDLRSIPEAVSEPVTSGLVFIRQPQIAWSGKFGKGWSYTAAIEQPGSSDILVVDSDLYKRNSVPDVIGNIAYGGTGGHFQVAGLLRRHDIFLSGGRQLSAWGAGVSVGAGVKVADKDLLSGSFTSGKGIARYLVGLDPIAGGVIISPGSPTTPGLPSSDISLRTNYGGYLNYRHVWNEKWRSNIYGGFTQSSAEFETPGLFKRSTFFSANGLYRINPFLTFGIEYMYGRKNYYSRDSLDNHRVLIGFQLY